MKKKEMYLAMGGRISMTSIGKYSDEVVIVGKFGMVSWMDDYWDIWITGVHHGKELSQRRVNSLCERSKACGKCHFHELTGEATAVVEDTELAYQIALILGARKKRVDTPETLAKNRARLAKLKKVA